MNIPEVLGQSPALVSALWIIVGLVAILLISLAVRARVFCQYLHQMTGIELSPSEVKEAFRRRGRDGVRELLLDRTIRADLEENPSLVPPESD